MLTPSQQTLWDDLNALVHKSTTGQIPSDFYINHQSYKDSNFVVFCHRLATYEDFLNNKNSRECRGHIFEIDSNGNPIRMVRWPLHKFFNLNENPFTMNVDLNTVDIILDKLDGSMISSVMIGDELVLVSKTSFHSIQAIEATKFIHDPKNRALYDAVYDITKAGYTVTMEWVGLNNLHVVEYADTDLKVLAVRSLEDGKYCNLWGINYVANTLRPFLVDRVELPKGQRVADFVDEVYKWPATKEGVILITNSGEYIKVKGDHYSSLHRVLGSMKASARNIYEMIVAGQIDDVIPRLELQPILRSTILEMNKAVTEYRNREQAKATAYFEANRHKDRKDYMTKLHSSELQLTPCVKTIATNLYLNKPLKDNFWLKQWDDFLKHHPQYIDIVT